MPTISGGPERRRLRQMLRPPPRVGVVSTPLTASSSPSSAAAALIPRCQPTPAWSCPTRRTRFPDGHGQGVLHEHVLAGLERGQGDGGVAVVVGGDEDGVHLRPSDGRLPV